MADLAYETTVRAQGFRVIAGLDEAGRGALAGPVVAGAVVLPLDDVESLAILHEVNDSKQLTPKRRDRFFDLITQNAVAYGVGVVGADVVDQIGILPATRQAMTTAVAQLALSPDYLLIDGRVRLKTLNISQQSIIRGDSKSLSIASASIIAKVTRDRLMVDLDETYPDYRFAQHKGYGTAVHLQAIAQHGPCPIHRYSFSPIRQTLI